MWSKNKNNKYGTLSHVCVGEDKAKQTKREATIIEWLQKVAPNWTCNSNSTMSAYTVQHKEKKILYKTNFLLHCVITLHTHTHA